MLVCLTWAGGRGWQPGVYSPLTRVTYFPRRNACARMLSILDSDLRTYALWPPGISSGQAATCWARLGGILGGDGSDHVALRAAGRHLVPRRHLRRLVFGDVNGRCRAFDQETAAVLREILGSPVTDYPIGFAAGARAYVVVSSDSAAQSSTQLRIIPELRPSAGKQPVRVRAA